MATTLVSAKQQAVGTTPVAVGNYSAPSANTGVVVTGLLASNRTNTTINATLYIQPLSGPATYLLFNSAIPPGGAITVADEGNRITLASGDQVVALAAQAAAFDVTMSVAQIN